MLLQEQAKGDLPTWLLQPANQLGLLLLLCILIFFTNLPLADPSIMEARNFITAREMVENGNWLLPTMNGQLRLAKPPLPTWITALAGIMAGDVENLFALRFPAACMATLMVMFLYFLSRNLTTDKLAPFLVAAVLATSFSMFQVGRQASWDIYCHSFMVGAIWLLVKGWKGKKGRFGVFVLAGLLLGFSFLSKGPVAFYGLLLPFFLAYGYGIGWQELKAHRKGLLLALAVFTAVSLSWPLYVYLAEPGHFAGTVSGESDAWLNRHNKPFWYYWGFAGQAGGWALFVIPALVVPYASRRIGKYGNYKFLLWWAVLALLLLSVIPEKKERYLLPAMVPLALLAGHLMRYLIYCFSGRNFSKPDYCLALVNTVLVVIVTFLVPVLAAYYTYTIGHLTGSLLLSITVFSFAAGYAILQGFRKYKLYLQFLAILLLQVVIASVGYRLYSAVRYPATNYQSLREVRKVNEVQGLRFYAVDGMTPQGIWQAGQPVDTVRVLQGKLQMPGNKPVTLFSPSPLAQELVPDAWRITKVLGMYRYSKEKPEKVYYAYVVSPERLAEVPNRQARPSQNK
ncbi:ArnT family glycosyltransferase [Pontibacter vulgaris]|uniref:ArnT family glycosyltransferase n=1 Tax=Pontibacter vulgaris TaxID=2905679 RepID=UPI001FA7E45E|nr:glycosyltransferase family 39 protein [Pontibacter vulgaris]